MPRPPFEADSRHRAIETLLLWEGRVSRARLLELFGVHGTQASRDLASFRQAYPAACEPEPATKSYVVSALFRPTLTTGDFPTYQRLVGAAGSPDEVRAGVPVLSTVPDATHIDHRVFRILHRAMRDGRAVKIAYRSLNAPNRHERLIRPHALIQAGPRWHLRAWCDQVKAFRDFNLGRIAQATLQTHVELPGAEADSAWNSQVKVRFVPHRGLSREQAQLVRDEYMGGTTALVHEVRVPLVRYLVQAFRAAVDPVHEPAPAHLLMVQAPESLPAGALW